MKDTGKIIIVLTVVCVACAALLASAFNSAEEKIALNEKKLVTESIDRLSPSTAKTKELTSKDGPLYALYEKNGSLNGYAFIASGQGYQGTIKILGVSDGSFLRLEGIAIIESVETPGLGAKIAKKPFLNQFKGLNVKNGISCVKTDPAGNDQIKAITGATISSEAVTRILNERLEQLRATVKINDVK